MGPHPSFIEPRDIPGTPPYEEGKTYTDSSNKEQQEPLE